MPDNPQSIESDSGTPSFPVVGIGASAGGLEAFLELFGALSPTTGMAFVLIQHLEPHHLSYLSEILSRATAMPVSEATDGLRLQANHVYVIPPNVGMTVKDKALHLSPRDQTAHPHHPVDIFFRSLAEDLGSAAIGVVLSGTSSDGAQGLRLIKTAAGTTLVQDTQSAKFPGMPESAVAASAVDFVLPPKDIAAELARIGAHPFVANGSESALSMEGKQGERAIQRILDRLRSATKVDFGQYKQNTIRRRIERRMLVHNVSTLADYLSVIEKKPAEIEDLYNDLLISVTSFFRGPRVFEGLSVILADLFKKRNHDALYRVWVPGCATGEEAYSLAIVAAEGIAAAGLDTPIQLFGTDISEAAIARARSAVYPDLIEREVSPARLRKYFTRVDAGYRISKMIRDSCVFARHDLLRDPPFSQLDLVSCRNVLIYFGSAAQQKIFPALHYSLKPDGLLLLGSAETAATRTDLFSVVDGEHEIFGKKTGSRRFTMTLPDPIGIENLTIERRVKEVVSAPTMSDIEARASRLLRDLFAPPGVIVNEGLQILNFFGHTNPFLQSPAGEATLNLLRVANPGLVMPIRRAFDLAVSTGQPTSESRIALETEGTRREIHLQVIPFTESGVRNFLLLFSAGALPPVPAHAGDIDRDRSSLEFQLSHVRRELAETRDYLRSIIEQHEVATEELRAASEEVQSSNEELHSTNEEIRTAKEELQSSNEELNTVNDELQHRNGELRSFNDDLNNILNAVNIPIVMLGMDLRIRRCTPAAHKLLNTVPGDIGRTMTDVHYALEVPNLEGMIRNTLETLAVQESRIQNRAGRWFTVSVRPYRTEDDRIDGAVVTFLDVDDLTRAIGQAEEARDFAEGIVETVMHPLVVLDNELRVQRATAAFHETFRISEANALHRPIYDVGGGELNIPRLRTLLDQVLSHDVPVRDLDLDVDFSPLGARTMRFTARRIVGSDHASRKLLLAIEDVTERREAAEIQYRRLFESAKDGILIVDAETASVIDVNPSFLTLTRNRRSDIAGKRLAEIPPFRKTEAIRTLVPFSLDKEATYLDAVPLVAHDGRRLLVEVFANRYRAREQSLVQINVRDVTERRQVENDLRRSNLDLQQFAFAASHDLQEPLRTVINQIQLLQNQYHGKMGADADETIEFITSAASRMRHMILDLLNYSQVSRAEMNVQPVRVESVLATAMSNLQLSIASTQATITFDSLPTVFMDPMQLLQLLQNLIGNALKYRSADPPHIHISAETAGREWILAVKDNGLGIDPKHHDHIFTVFRRLHGKEYPGTGVGLAICKRIAERHLGRIWVESEAGKGSTFYVTVPMPAESDKVE